MIASRRLSLWHEALVILLLSFVAPLCFGQNVFADEAVYCAQYNFQLTDTFKNKKTTKDVSTDLICAKVKDDKIVDKPYVKTAGSWSTITQPSKKGSASTKVQAIEVDGYKISTAYLDSKKGSAGYKEINAKGMKWSDLVGKLETNVKEFEKLYAHNCSDTKNCHAQSAKYINKTSSKDVDNFKNGDDPSKPLATDNLNPDSAGSVSNADDSEDASAHCFRSTGALGWVLCPVITIGGGAVSAMADKLLEPFLTIDVSIFSSSAQNMLSAWQQFQMLANIAFVALFIFVIFSQITGVGIDNYGIKKVLPKLIIGAVLINASYIVCQLAVELSNIFGLGIKNIFQGIAQSIDEVSVIGDNGMKLATNVGLKSAGALGVVVGVTKILPKFGLLTLGEFVPAALLAALLALIVIAVSVLFLYVLLAMRSALAVLLVVVSPVAFATYLLDGTKKAVFDKWLNLFKGLLLAFPIISLVVFGGQAVARILLSANGADSNLGYVMAAAIMSVAPVFFIPKLLISSFGALSGLAERARRALPNYGGLKRSAESGRGIGQMGAFQTLNQRKQDAERDRRIQNAKNRMAKLEEQKKKAEANGQTGRVASINRQMRSLGGIVNQASQEDIESYKASHFAKLNQNEIVGGFSDGKSINEGGSFSTQKLLAGLDSIIQDDNFLDAYYHLSQNKDFQEKMATDAEFRSAINGRLIQRGGPVFKAIAMTNGQAGDKGLGATAFDLSNNSEDGAQKTYTKNIQSLSDNEFNGIKKDSINAVEGKNADGETEVLFDPLKDIKATQAAHIASQGLTGKEGKAFAELVGRMGSEQASAIASGMSATSISNIKSSSDILALGGFGEKAYDIGQLLDQAGGNIDAVSVAGNSEEENQALRLQIQQAVDKFRADASAGITELNSSSGDSLRGNMNQTVAVLSGVKANRGPMDVRVVGGGNDGGSSDQTRIDISHSDNSGSSQAPQSPQSPPQSTTPSPQNSYRNAVSNPNSAPRAQGSSNQNSNPSQSSNNNSSDGSRSFGAGL